MPYTATITKNPGRQAWLVEFRHPLRMDSSGKPGKKMRKGLGTSDEARATHLVGQLNQLLANEALHAVGEKDKAAHLYEPEVVEIFFGEIEPRALDARPLRDKLMPLPSHQDGYARVVMLGVPGAGKTTLVRQFIATDPKREAFPSTSMNRTTTFPTEIVLKSGDFGAAVTFMSEHETRFEVEECISAAVVDAVNGDHKLVARTFLEKSDMRFRLKYILGDLSDEVDAVDPYADDVEDDEDEVVTIPAEVRERNQAKVRDFTGRILKIAEKYREIVESANGPLSQMTPSDRAAALILIEEQADASDEFLELVSDVLDELRSKFDKVPNGKFDKTTTGWPRGWQLKVKSEQRAEFLTALRQFSGVSDRYWGSLLTPLVNGMRVEGPFQPKWASIQPRLVLTDTEGLGHKANSTADMPEQTLVLLHEADVILLVDSAKNGLTNYAAGKALEGIANAGLTRKLAMVFTHMDMAAESGLKGERLHDQVFSGLRNVIENQLSKSVVAESARYLLEHLQGHTYYVGRLDKAQPKGAEPELNKLLAQLMAAQPQVVEPVAFPEYDSKFLMMALQEAAKDFRKQWEGYLNIAHDSEFKPQSWQSLKALSRRYAENWGENFHLRPTANLRSALQTAIARYLETPIGWCGHPTEEQKRDAIEALKKMVSLQLPALVRRRLRETPQPQWHQAWGLRGAGSTVTRRLHIDSIFKQYVPVPEARGDQLVVDFVNEIEGLVQKALGEFKARVEGGQKVAPISIRDILRAKSAVPKE